MQLRNPIIPGFYPDPSVCRVGRDFYLVTSSFEYFPGVPLFHSHDLLHWRQIGHCLTRPSQLPLEHSRPSGGIFAPTIRHHNERYYMVTTNMTHGGHFYVCADDPAGEWSEPIWIDTGLRGIDPSLLFDDDGEVYFTSTGWGQGIVQCTIDIASGEPTSEVRQIWSGTGGAWAEAPHLYKINGLYYLLLAEGGTGLGHMCTLARSESPWGPFEPCPHNPILSHRSSDLPLQATGHAELIDAGDGSWWLAFLGIRPVGAFPMTHHLGRETNLAPVQWTADGWPVVGLEGHVPAEIEIEPLPLAPWPAAHVRDDFGHTTLALCWNHLRNPQPGSWSLTGRPGHLRLQGSALTLSDVDAPAFVGRRQQHMACRATCRLLFDPANDHDEAGLTVFMNDQHHYEIAVRRTGGHRCIIMRRQIGSLRSVVAIRELPAGPVTLSMTADAASYTLSYAANDDALQPLATCETRYLSTEVAGGFTGVYIAMYATGNGQAAAAPADFDWFEYEPLK